MINLALCQMKANVTAVCPRRDMMNIYESFDCLSYPLGVASVSHAGPVECVTPHGNCHGVDGSSFQARAYTSDPCHTKMRLEHVQYYQQQRTGLLIGRYSASVMQVTWEFRKMNAARRVAAGARPQRRACHGASTQENRTCHRTGLRSERGTVCVPHLFHA